MQNMTVFSVYEAKQTQNGFLRKILRKAYVRFAAGSWIVQSYEQALVCLSNRKLSTRAEDVHFIAKWRITVK